MTDGMHQPPAVWARLLRLALPSEDAEWLTLEMAELYRARRDRRGDAAARRWYRGEVLRFGVDRIHHVLVRLTKKRPDRRREARLQDITRDVRYAARSLRRNPGFTAVAILTLTLGIGANTLLFSIVDHVLFRALPYPNPEQLVAIWPTTGMLRGELAVMQRDSRSFRDIGGYVTTDGFNLATATSSRRVQGALITPSLLNILGIDASLGRDFDDADTRPGNDAVVLITETLWTSEYGADQSIIGRMLEIDGHSRTVVGVVPSPSFPRSDLDILIPLVMDPSDAGVFWGWGGHRAIGRLAPGATPQTAQSELRTLSSVMRESNTLWSPVEDFRSQAVVLPLQDFIVDDSSSTLYVLLSAVGLVLLVACLNVANLQLGRGVARRRDVALRSALGASRQRIAREQMVESILVSIGGCIAALIAAGWALRGLVAILPPSIPRVHEITLDLRVIAFGVAASMIAGVVSGVLPAVRGARTDPATTLRESTAGSRGGSAARRRFGNGLVMAQITFAVLLITGAGLLIRTLSELSHVDRGFDATSLLTARLNLAGDQFDDPEDRARFFEDVLDRVHSIPGVRDASIASRVPFGVSRGGIATFIEGVTQDPNNLPVLYQASISPEYLETLDIPLLEGRALSSVDRTDGPLVALIDETAARQFWPGESPLGRRIRYPWQGAPWIEIVGVVGSVADADLTSARDPMFYQPLAQRPPGAVSLVINAPIDQTGLIEAIRTAVQQVDATVPVSRVVELESLVGESVARTRWTAILLTTFAAVALLLGCVGVYGVVAYSVRTRTQEIGVRMALGADSSRIRAAVLGDGVNIVLPGLIVGLLLAIPGGRLIEGLLFGVRTFDLATFVSVPVVLALSALLAVYIPARRATGVHPVEALRDQ